MIEQPKENIVATSARVGTCTTCGAKSVLVTHPPLPRCVDMAACEQQRKLNRIAYAHGQVRIGARR